MHTASIDEAGKLQFLTRNQITMIASPTSSSARSAKKPLSNSSRNSSNSSRIILRLADNVSSNKDAINAKVETKPKYDLKLSSDQALLGRERLVSVS